MSSVAGGIFNKRNLVKILTIFIVGFISRVLVNHYFDINVFADCFSFVSTTYYLCMAAFVVAVNHLVEVFDFPHLMNLLSFESIKPLIAMWGQFTRYLTKF
jgi:energy-converting hydrogenase Eha subunit C